MNTPDRPVGVRRRLRRPVALAQALIARRTVRLAPEPPGERRGVLTRTALPSIKS